MRHLEKIVNGILIYMAVYLPALAVLQAVTGTDLSAFVTVGGASGIVELALTAIIQIKKQKADRKSAERGMKDEQDQLEAETFES